MGAQSAINKLIGTAGAGALAISKLDFGKEGSTSDKSSGVDAKMAAKARKTAQQKIKTIQANKEISDKAKSRRVGQVLDEYSKSLGGK